MISPNEFWLYVHRLADAYDAEGLTPEERTANIIEQFREMSPIARRELLRDLLSIANHTSDLYTLAIAAANESDRERDRRQAAPKAG